MPQGTQRHCGGEWTADQRSYEAGAISHSQWYQDEQRDGRPRAAAAAAMGKSPCKGCGNAGGIWGPGEYRKGSLGAPGDGKWRSTPSLLATAMCSSQWWSAYSLRVERMNAFPANRRPEHRAGSPDFSTRSICAFLGWGGKKGGRTTSQPDRGRRDASRCLYNPSVRIPRHSAAASAQRGILSPGLPLSRLIASISPSQSHHTRPPRHPESYPICTISPWRIRVAPLDEAPQPQPNPWQASRDPSAPCSATRICSRELLRRRSPTRARSRSRSLIAR